MRPKRYFGKSLTFPVEQSSAGSHKQLSRSLTLRLHKASIVNAFNTGLFRYHAQRHWSCPNESGAVQFRETVDKKEPATSDNLTTVRPRSARAS